MYQIHRQDILEWAKSKQGQLTWYRLGKGRGILISLFELSVCGLRDAVARMAEGNQVNQIIGAFIVTIEKAKRYLVMNYQGLAESILTLFFGQAAILTGMIISLEGFTSLGVPVWAVPVALIAVNVVWGVFPYPMLITAFARTVFTLTSMAFGLFKVDVKLPLAIKAVTNHATLGAVSSDLVLTSRRTVFTPAMLESAGNYIKSLFAIDILADSFDCLFQNKTPLSVGSLSRRYPISRQRGLI